MYIHTYIQAQHTYAHILAQIHTFIFICIHTYTYINAHVHSYALTTYMHIDINKHTYINTHTGRHACIHEGTCCRISMYLIKRRAAVAVTI